MCVPMNRVSSPVQFIFLYDFKKFLKNDVNIDIQVDKPFKIIPHHQRNPYARFELGKNILIVINLLFRLKYKYKRVNNVYIIKLPSLCVIIQNYSFI